MEVTRHDFNAKLPFVLQDIVNADFVAIDLELSGIPGQQPNKSRRDGQASNGLPTLQERYTDIKKAAEKYQVLQLGITCALSNIHEGRYVLKPYNFFLNPLPDSRLDIERTISYQSGAVEFLISHGFRMEAPYLEGVSYLSRSEEIIARHIRLARAAIPDMEIRESDSESIQFLEGIREYIESWRHGRELQPTDFLNIPPPPTVASKVFDRGLNGFKRRLVHQYVRATYPDLVTVSRQGFIQVLPFDKTREDANQARKDRAFEQNVETQIGLRWLVEAMAGGSLTGLTMGSFLTYVDGREDEVAQQVSELKDALQSKRTVLVGHNVFTDLVYFYHCFFGELPESVKDFQSILHQLFPLVIDTKYLATYNDVNPGLAKSSLEELNDELSAQDFPLVETHESHIKYAFDKPAHEAGYDSFLTAKVLIRLSAKIEAEGYYVDNPDYVSTRQHNAPPNQGADSAADQKASDSSGIDLSNQLDGGDVQVSKHAKPHPPSKEIDILPSQSKDREVKQRSKFSHAGRYDVLEDIESDSQDQSTSEGQGPADTGSNSQSEYTMMPSFDSHFWAVNGNRLRVNGTVEGVCELMGGLKVGSGAGKL